MKDLFKQIKEGNPENNEASSALWLHSKALHNGYMRIVHWKTKILSSHITALNRQETEASLMSNEGVDALLNSKNDFGQTTYQSWCSNMEQGLREQLKGDN